MNRNRALFAELRSRPGASRTLAVLRELSEAGWDTDGLLNYHEALLFYKAYPVSARVRHFCEQELRDFHHRVKAAREEYGDDALGQSGVAGSRIDYPYDEEMTRWLMKRVGRTIRIDWDTYEDRDSDPLAAFLPLLMETMEGDAIDDADLSVRDLVEAAAGKGYGSTVEWLIEQFARAFPKGLQQHNYNSMELPLTLDLLPRGPSRSLTDDGSPRSLFLWDPERAKATFNLTREVLRPLHIGRPVSAARGRELMDLCYGTLLVRLRELYPATHSNPEEVYDLPLERGIRLIVWFMSPSWRLPLEAGWGLLMLKNNVPIGYGAGGMLYDRSEIAINVFDTFRGGEAAWLYSQYARVFHAFCGAPWLVTRKYQIGGEGNDEGILSGAYWFYDKLGFRSVDGELREIADHERRLIASTRGYRTSKRTLRKLAEADIVFSLTGRDPSEYREFPLGKAGILATRFIASVFGGSRDGLERKVLALIRKKFGLNTSGWKEAERVRLAQNSLCLLAIPGVEGWPARDLRAAFELFRLKGSAREGDYARQMRKCGRFFRELERAALS